ncbi:hypothetical protein DSCO28_64760 [Desulfosarcina ovata subsp. sediminis]|uniref:Helix-turn-helix domain-containing protein n=1 Tax=Desulfosarcina ovata subsp. sediminis TaxID=885957 RepID=A0A5K8A0Q3_9BACT|nr:hypothetical protein DSCO28_64760 [Desulfosarcina ovata subsp. sediminis]
MHKGVNAIAERLNVSRKTVLRWICDEGLPAFKTSNKTAVWRCLESSLCDWLKTFEQKHLGRK